MKKGRVLIAFLLVLLAASFIPVHCLEIEELRKGSVLSVYAVSSGDSFSIGYKHSVELCSVWDYYRIDETFRIVLYETTFPSCNTGLPVAPSENETFHNDGDRFRISNMNRIIPSISLWVNEEYDNTIMIGDEASKLYSLAGNTLLGIAIEKETVVRFLLMKARILLK
ncbi:MAG: DUF1850 domain-containing protein [Deltaproteobacteria bacterium]|nr:DUF1850 domain-containing protein [Deltaproteobacteria bacterium]